MEYYSATKWNHAMCSNMNDLECHTEWSKSDKKREILYDIAYVWNQNIIKMNLFAKQKETHKLRE